MLRITRGTTFALLLALAGGSAACSDDEEAAVPPVPPPSDAGTDGDAGPPLPDPICLQPGPGPYALAFTDVTIEMGLGPEGLGATGSNVAITDLDGDHWPDILLTKGSAEREDPADPQGLYHLYRNTGAGSFEDVTWTSGLFRARDGTDGRGTTFVVFADVDNDGDLDAFSSVYEDSGSGSLDDQSSLFLNNGDGTFTIGPLQSFTSGSRDPLVGAAFLDHDHNGLLDLFVGHHYGTYGNLGSTIQDSLFAGDGLGNFIDVTDAAGLATVQFSSSAVANGNTHKPTWGVTACDVDGDGWTDLMTNSYGRQFNALYRNLGGGLYEDLTLTSGFAHDDIEDYGDNQFYRCYCQAHPAEPACDGASSPVIVCDGLENAWNVGMDDQPWRLGGNSSNAVCGDLDNDGDMDILAVELAHWHIGASSDLTELLYNDGFPGQPFSRPGNDTTGLTRQHSSGWNEGDLGGALADFDNDGRLDVLVASSDYPGTASLLWQQGADGKFTEVGFDAGAKVHRAHGIGVIDYDRDGDYDLIMGTSLMRWGANDNPPKPDDAFAYLLRNDGGQAANKLMVHLVGTGLPDGANRGAVGAQITAQAGGRTHLREIQGAYGLTGFQQDQLMVIGLGDACTAEQLAVRWPNAAGEEQTFTDVLANYVVVIEEGVGLSYQTLEEYAPQ